MTYEEIEITTPDGETRKAGELVNGVFITRREPEHYMRKYNGFGISDEVLRKLERTGADEIKIVYEKKNGEKKTYISTPGNWRENGIVAREGGFEEQVFLSEYDFDSVIDGEEKQTTLGER